MCDKEKKVGLQVLDDDALSTIVEEDLHENGELTTFEAKAAFRELARRTPE